jgi:predicted RNase H-like nuclease (RuvC/YqgF family)
LSEGELAQTKAKLSDLFGQLSALNDVNAKLISEIQTKDLSIDTQNQQIDSLRQRVNALSTSLEETNEQNNKLFSVNQTLTNGLMEEYRKSIALVRERSDILTDKLTIMDKLNEAKTKIAILEHQAESNRKINDLGILHRKENLLRDNQAELQEETAKQDNYED